MEAKNSLPVCIEVVVTQLLDSITWFGSRQSPYSLVTNFTKVWPICGNVELIIGNDGASKRNLLGLVLLQLVSRLGIQAWQSLQSLHFKQTTKTNYIIFYFPRLAPLRQMVTPRAHSVKTRCAHSQNPSLRNHNCRGMMLIQSQTWTTTK